jgi:hypothetical protein
VETHLIDAPSGVGDGFAASEVGFKIFCAGQFPLWIGPTDQTYLAIVHLQGDLCEEHGWDDHPTDHTKCADFDF